MHQYGVSDVEKLLGLSRSTIRALVDAGFVKPARGARNALLFSFQDLIVLRTAQALAAVNVPHRRITKSLKELRKHLPEEMPLSGLRIGAIADRVVVSEGGRHWQADSGQYLLAFEGDPVAGSLSVIERKLPAAVTQVEEAPERARVGADEIASPDADEIASPNISQSRTDEWFDRAVALEQGDIGAAIRAYERAIAADPKHLEARINLGRLLHDAGRLAQAERVYRDAIKSCGSDAVVFFNLAVLLDDMGRKPEAVVAYEAAVHADPTMADAHYNLALLYEQVGKPKDAIRHMAQYRRLVGKD
jgi:tetratricopeptide (TPR) repeat protein